MIKMITASIAVMVFITRTQRIPSSNLVTISTRNSENHTSPLISSVMKATSQFSFTSEINFENFSDGNSSLLENDYS